MFPPIFTGQPNLFFRLRAADWVWPSDWPVFSTHNRLFLCFAHLFLVLCSALIFICISPMGFCSPPQKLEPPLICVFAALFFALLQTPGRFPPHYSETKQVSSAPPGSCSPGQTCAVRIKVAELISVYWRRSSMLKGRTVGVNPFPHKFSSKKITPKVVQACSGGQGE